jgi:hypothetical protein
MPRPNGKAKKIANQVLKHEKQEMKSGMKNLKADKKMIKDMRKQADKY